MTHPVLPNQPTDPTPAAVTPSAEKMAEVTGKPGDVQPQIEAESLLEQKMDAVGRLAGAFAHDFNNFLTIISGNASMLLDQGSLPPAASEALKRVFTASQQASGLVRQLLLSSSKRLPTPEVVDLNTETEQVTGTLRRLLGETVVVGFEPSPESPRVSADVDLLEQLLVNLATNARDAMARGGRLSIAVGLRPRGGAVPKEGLPEPADAYASLTVRDTGCGIPASVLPRIFEPFFTTKQDGRATGLGLATARDIVNRHAGWIEVETEVGVGTEFRIYLPLARAEAESPSAPGPALPRKAGKGTLLLVEDESGVREFAAAVLKQDGYTILQAESGESALEVWRWHSARIDLLLSDVVLPGEISGTQLGARLQAEKPALKVIFTSGYSLESVAPAANGIHQFVLSKPYTPRSLLRAVHNALA